MTDVNLIRDFQTDKSREGSDTAAYNSNERLAGPLQQRNQRRSALMKTSKFAKKGKKRGQLEK